MKSINTASLVLGAVACAVGYALIAVNIVGLRRSKRISRIVD